MIRSLLRFGVALLALLFASPGAAARVALSPTEIVVVKRDGISAHAEVAEEFADRCRVRARVVNLVDGRVAELRRGLVQNDVVLAVGQRALDAVIGSSALVVSALVPIVPVGVIAADGLPPPELALRALKAARPSLRRVGVVHGPRTDRLVAELSGPAGALGLTLVMARASDGPHAVRELHRIIEQSPSIDALWLAPDVDVLTSQLFQYALTLEIERGLPIAAPTRQLVRSGALLSIDADPRAVGRKAAEIANRLLAGEEASFVEGTGRAGGLELIVNADVARRLGVTPAGLAALGALFE